MDNVARVITLSLEGYDGIIHKKPFGVFLKWCDAYLNKVSEDYKIPILILRR